MNPTPIEMLKLTPVSSRAALLPLPEVGVGALQPQLVQAPWWPTAPARVGLAQAPSINPALRFADKQVSLA
jgi:hypothetical protein